jgi:DNA modification methylase
MIKKIKNDSFGELVNFKKNQNEIIHRWFNIKEGYSKELIFKLIDDLKIKKEDFIVDFFNGSGTTSLAVKEIGIPYYGFEVNPFLFLLSKVKTNDYSKKDIENIIVYKKALIKDYKKVKNIKEVKLSIIKKVFKENLSDILKIRTLIFKIKDTKMREFFLVALTTILEDVGYSKKDGNGLKYPKNKKALNFINKFSEQIDLMLSDIEDFKFKNTKNSKIILSDSRNINKKHIDNLKNKTSLVVFSPPYANCFDYSEVYKLELWMSGYIDEYEKLNQLRNESLSSHLNKNLNHYQEHPLLKESLSQIKNTWSKKIPLMISGYFYDMEKIIENSFSIIKKGGYCVIIVGNSAYSGHIIKTDEILSKIAMEKGFSEIEIHIARKLRASSQQAKLFNNENSLRESVIIMKK